MEQDELLEFFIDNKGERFKAKDLCDVFPDHICQIRKRLKSLVKWKRLIEITGWRYNYYMLNEGFANNGGMYDEVGR